MLQELDRTTAPPTERAGNQAQEQELLERLRAGDEREFTRILQGWSPAMLRVAACYVHGPAAAEDVVQETWLALLAGLARFEGRSSLRTWTFSILVNRARTYAVRDSRTVPMSELDGADDGGPTVDPARFQGPDGQYPGHWTSAGSPQRWSVQPEDAALAGEVRAEISAALAGLPQRQRTVVTLRDVVGMSSDEACEVLGIAAPNQRVLLHRARARLRSALEDYCQPTGGSG
jgi:RNA polymerase sigma-70 factor, ECF subfamily